MNDALAELNKSIYDISKWYSVLLEFMVALQGLNDERVDALFEKYDVVITKRECNGAKEGEFIEITAERLKWLGGAVR